MQCGSGQVSTANRHFKKSESYRFRMTVSEDLQTGTGKMGMRRNLLWKTHRYYSILYFMQAGFAMVETGFTRAKNSGNILMKNMMDFVLGSIFFFIIGFALMFGGSNAFIGTAGFFHPKSLADADGMFNGLPIGVFMIFQTVFCATSATIVSGAMAERTKFISYLIYSAAISIFIYPITGSGAAAG